MTAGPGTPFAPLVQPVFLLGMMGSGKSTVGRCMAAATDAVFVDLDARIELLFGASIPELFASGGEGHFRELEAQALRSLLAEPGFARRGVVVATGGGIVVVPSNVDAMCAAGVTVFLDVPVPVLVERLSAHEEASGRPMLGEDPAEIEQRVMRLLSDRRGEYERAHLRDPGDDDPEQVAARILRRMEQLHAS